MDDLAGLDWGSAPSNNAPPKSIPIPSQASLSYPSLRPTPSPSASGRSTPLTGPGQGGFNKPPPPKSSTPANDSFASLLGPSRTAAQNNNLTLQQRQQQLLEEKAKKDAEERKRFEAQFGSQESQWTKLGHGAASTLPASSSTNFRIPPPGTRSPQANAPGSPFPTANGRQNLPASLQKEDTDDILAAFSASAPVDKSSHFPPPAISGAPSRVTSPPATTQPAANGYGNPYTFDDDDDPFGLSQIANRPAQPSQPVTSTDDDDFMGMLGKPAEEVVRARTPVELPQQRRTESPRRNDETAMDPRDKAVAELVDMGFPADKAAVALAGTDNGINVQAAVGVLLNQAHDEAKSKAQSRQRDEAASGERSSRSTRGAHENEAIPSRMRREQAERDRSGSRPRDDRGANGEKDVTQMAQEFGSSLFKSANSLWKTGQKKVQKAVADFQAEGGDPSQPKWMRDAQMQASAPSKSKPQRAEVTDEAAMLDGGGRPDRSAARQRPADASFTDEAPPRPARRPQEAATRPRETPAPSSQIPKQSTRGYKFEDNDDDLLVSSSRRRGGTPSQSATTNPPTSQAPSSTARPLAPSDSSLQSRNPFSSSDSQPAPTQPQRPSAKAPTPRPTPRPQAPARQIPPVDPSVLSQSAKHRIAGGQAFKRGDYASAHESYNSALRQIPQRHPICIVILCNRALTALKTGDAKSSVTDADNALSIIGIARGENEKIEVAPGELKDMKEFYGKALMRKAEALESLERWNDALNVWKQAVESNVGGSVAIQGRNRAEKAVGGGSSSSKPTIAAPSRTSTPSTSSTARRSATRPAASRPAAAPSPAEAEAVSKLRAQHLAQTREEDEKFALTDTVDAKMTAWRGSKKDNLRALLGSLDTVLWPEAGWTKVGMGDLVMPGRVKVVYMKAIGKMHPDKIAQNATTEQRMLAAAIFATLNEAWDGFKRENGL